MKQNAQAILLFTGYPLEPIVALQVKKSFQSHAPAATRAVAPKKTSAPKTDKKKEFTS